MTNEEYIKSMNTREMAQQLAAVIDCSCCPLSEECDVYLACYENLEKWLYQEATND